MGPGLGREGLRPGAGGLWVGAAFFFWRADGMFGFGILNCDIELKIILFHAHVGRKFADFFDC